MDRTKYIVTSENYMIVFPETFNHSDFKHLNPISAGFISFGVDVDEDGLECVMPSCYGESVTLDIKSREDDIEIARRQILNHDVCWWS